jgi:DNA-directed RNA polymerase subunit RPC12/RpoP
MAGRYVCSNCLHDINTIFSLPPVSPVAICRNCGFRMRRCVGSIARAWMGFSAACTFLLFFVMLTLFNLLLCESVGKLVGAVLGSFILAALLSIGGALGGYFLGLIIGLMSNAAWGSPVVSRHQIYKVVAAASAEERPDPRLYQCLNVPREPSGPRLETRRCWHCGHAFQTSTRAGTRVECPQCNANLGVANASDLD